LIIPDQLYTYAQIAAFASVNDRSVREWVQQKKIAYIQLPGGRGRRISGAQWLDAIRSGAVSAVR
jgi:excisionase family DNA binding protein